MTTILDVVGAVLILAGSLLTLLAAVGVVRFPDVLTRMHALSKLSTLGLVLILLATALLTRSRAVTGLVVLVTGFLLLTVPVSTHLVARAAYRRGQHLPMTTDDLAEVELTEPPDRPRRRGRRR